MNKVKKCRNASLRLFDRFVMWLKRRTCRHSFALEALKLTDIPEPVKPEVNDYAGWTRYWDEYYSGDWVTKRVRWPCAKCGKVFYDHCGLDISPEHGPMFRQQPLETTKAT